MKKSRFASTWIPVLLAGVLLVTACEPQPPAERPAGAETSNPENTTAAPGQIVLAQNLTVLDPATIELMAPVEQGTVTAEALETQTGGVITFPGATKSRIALNPGDVLAAGVTNRTPLGLLRKVTEVNETPAGVEVATEQATLEDAIVEGEFEDHAILELPPSSAQANPGRRE